MKKTVRLLLPDKKGIGRRVQEAVRSARGDVVHTRIAKRMRGLNVVDVLVACEDPASLEELIPALGKIPSVTIVSVEDPS